MTTTCIAVIGGGNGAQAAVPIIAGNTGATVHLCSPYGDEAQALMHGVKSSGGLRAVGAGLDARCCPDLITADPGLAVAEADFVVLITPAFAHAPLLSAIIPHLKPGACVAAVPARSGFEFEAGVRLAGAGRRDVTYSGFDTLPWACRVKQYGQLVEILGVKRELSLASSPGRQATPLAEFWTKAFGVPVHTLPDCVNLSLANMGQIIHPGIMYGLFRDRPSVTFEPAEVPLFYQSVDDEIANVLGAMSEEVLEVAAGLRRATGGTVAGGKVPHLRDWLMATYPDQIEDSSTLALSFSSNRAYRGLRVPVCHVDGGRLAPCFSNRYLTEDLPFGLVVTRGLAELAHVSTPVMDEVIRVTSTWVGREYLVDGEFGGRDLDTSRCPQRYGITDVESLIPILSDGRERWLAASGEVTQQ